MNTNRQAKRINVEMDAYFVTKSTKPDATPVTWNFVCDCGREKSIHTKPGSPTEYIITKIRRTGWTIRHRSKPVCPVCLATRTEGAVATTTTAEVSVPDFKLVRKVMSKLDDVFDEVTRRYRSGYSDDKVVAS